MPKKPQPLPQEPGEPHLIGYARVSTVDQNPQMQIDALVKAGVDPSDIYWEKASGASRKRREFDAMMKDARDGDVVVVWKLDRLGRSLKQIIETIEKLDKRGAKIRCLTQPIDTTTPWGRLILHVLAAVAEVERELGRERTIAGLKSARERGRVSGRKPKHGLEALERAYAQGGSFRAGASLLKPPMTLTGFKRALERERANKALKDEE